MRIFINSRTQSTHARAAAFKSLATAPKSLKGQKQSQATNGNQTTKAMTILDLTYDETRNPSRRDPRNFISSPRGDELYKATANILPWEAATWDTGDRVVVPSVFLEKIVRLAPVPDPDGLSSLSFITQTLDCDGWLREAITVLIGEGLLHDQDEDERWNLVIFEHPQAGSEMLQRHQWHCLDQVGARHEEDDKGDKGDEEVVPEKQQDEEDDEDPSDDEDDETEEELQRLLNLEKRKFESSIRKFLSAVCHQCCLLGPCGESKGARDGPEKDRRDTQYRYCKHQ